MTSKTMSMASVWRRVLLAMVVITAAVALPQACHLLGRQLGYGSALGEMLLQIGRAHV